MNNNSSSFPEENTAGGTFEVAAGWISLLGLVLFSIGFMALMEFIPPPSPADGAEVFATRYEENAFGIRLGAIFLLLGIPFLLPIYAAISTAILRMSTRSLTLAYIQFGAGLMIVMPALIMAILFATISFRPERGIEYVYLMSDFSWLLFVTVTPPVTLQTLVTGWAILIDKSPTPVFPRWVGFLNIWVGILAIPGVFAVLFKTGPFAWDGLLAFWLPLGVFFVWFAVMLWQIISQGKRVFHGK